MIGNGVNKRNDADKASSLHDTQGEANKAAREMLQNQGGESSPPWAGVG